VESSCDLERNDPCDARQGVRQTGECVERTGGHDLPCAVAVGRRQAGRLDRRNHLVGLAAEAGSHTGGGVGGRFSHRRAALASDDECCLVAQHSGQRSRGEFADAVARVVPRALVLAEERVRGRKSGGDQQRLAHSGVADLLRAAVGAELHQVEPDDFGVPPELVCDAGNRQPRAEKSGCLGALSGRKNR
jgi:hypothetical protein